MSTCNKPPPNPKKQVPFSWSNLHVPAACPAGGQLGPAWPQQVHVLESTCDRIAGHCAWQGPAGDRSSTVNVASKLLAGCMLGPQVTC
jgi:hypothetical protein